MTESPSLVSQPPETKTTPEPASSQSTVPEAAPEPFTFDKLTLPEGFTVDDETSKSFTDLINDASLSPAEKAQKLVDLQVGLATKSSESAAAQWVEVQKQWQDQARADPVIGGDKLEPALGAIAKLIDSQGEAAASIRQVMDLTGAGNHPVMIKFLSKIASEFSEGGPVPGDPPAGQQSLAQKLFPSMKA